MNPAQTPPLRTAMIAQLVGAAIVGLLSAGWAKELSDHLLFIAFFQGIAAAITSKILGGPAWWLPIHLSFIPLVIMANRLGIPAWVWFGGFIFLLLVFWRTDQSRVPLYLTNKPTSAAIDSLIPQSAIRVIDLGCGDGRLLRRLASLRPDCKFTGFEHAPLTWVWAWLLSRKYPNVAIHLGNFWQHSLADYDVAYAFLSPSPMPQLWAKALSEMRPSALLICNSFPIPDIAPEATIPVLDRRKTLLFCYRPIE